MTSKRAKWLCLVPSVIIMAVAVIVLVLTRAIVPVPQQPGQETVKVGSAQSVSSQADDKPDLTKNKNNPYRPVNVELFQPEYRFEVIGTDVTPGTGLRWILVNRTKDGGRMIFRVLISDSFGPIERGRVVRLGFVHFWSNPGYEGSIVVVLAIE